MSGSNKDNRFELEWNLDRDLIDFISNKPLKDKPEERVRQTYLRTLHYEYQYPKNLISTEVPIQHGSKYLKDKSGNPIFADIVIYKSPTDCKNRDQGKISLVVECKRPNEKSGYNQLVSYIFNTSADGGVWFNGKSINHYRRLIKPDNKLIDWTGIPRPNESWDSIGRRKKSELRRPKDIKRILRVCHNKLHGRGVDGEEDDLTMDMVRLLLAKAMDEEKSGTMPSFYCTPEEYSSSSGQKDSADRIHKLFDEVKNSHPDIFDKHEKISVGKRAICDVVTELQSYRLLSNLHSSNDWDLMGGAYEEYTATYLKKKRGQYFTNRLVIELMVNILKPNYTDIILDPAGGSGGFLTGTMRYIRKKILNSSSSQIAKQRQLDKHRTNLYMVEISKRLVKISKTAMILNGDGHTGMTQGDTLGDFGLFNDSIVASAGKGKPNIILTNPPFAGVGDGKISDLDTIRNFSTSKRWTKHQGKYKPTEEFVKDGVPPEMLFFERCLDWLAPGGKLGIVMPKSFLDTATYLPARKLMFQKSKLLAVINCHKDTFQPHTGVRTSLIFLEKNFEKKISKKDYSIFMGISKKLVRIVKVCQFLREINQIKKLILLIMT